MRGSQVAEKMSSRILVLVPSFNEAEHIATVVNQARKFLPVLVVDDGSADETSSIARENGAFVYRQEPNQGKGTAMMNGFKYALENGYTAVITLDGDGQHDPEEIPIFVKEFELNKSDLIIGQRDFRKMPFIRMCSNSIGTWMYSWAMGQYIPDNQSGYRLISARLMRSMTASAFHGFEFEVEMIMRCLMDGEHLSWVPIRTIYAGEHSHITPIRHAWRFLLLTFRTRKVMKMHQRATTSK
jgi:glycosyltransferase involved in cell wall biosynthesis